MLTAVSWDGGGGDLNWNNSANWSGDAVPGASDDVTIDIPNVEASIFGASGSIHSLTSYEDIVIFGSDLDIAANSSIASIHQLGGSLTGTGNIDVIGDYIWHTGTLAGHSTLTVHGRLEFQEAGAFNNFWQLVERRLVSQGNAHATGTFGPDFTTAMLLLYGGAEFHNAGSFDIETTVGMRFVPMDSSSTKVINSGTFTNTSNVISTLEGVPFENSGSLVVANGQLQLHGGLTNTGNLDVAHDATLLVGSLLNSTGTTSGDGHLYLQFVTQLGSLDFAGNITLEGATLEGDFHAGHNVIVNNAAFNGSPATIAGAASIIGGWNGTGAVTVDGLITWNIGAWIIGSGTIVANGGLVITGSGQSRLAGMTLENAGSALFDGGTIEMDRGAVIHNLPGGIFEVRNNAAMFNTYNSPQPHFDNEGMLLKLEDTITSLTVPFNNSGTVDIQAGQLVLTSEVPSESTGNFNIGSGATLAVSGTFTSTSDFTGAGSLISQFAILQGMVNLGGNVTLEGVTLEGDFHAGNNVVVNNATFNGSPATIGGTVAIVGGWNGSGSVTVDGLITWNIGAWIIGSGIIVANGGLVITGSGQSRLAGMTLENAGSALFDGGTIEMDRGAVIHNLPGGLFEVRNNAAMFNTYNSPQPHFDNEGMLLKLEDTITSLTVPFNNSGIVDIQAGQLVLTSEVPSESTGHFNIGSGATLAVSGTFTSTSQITGDGSLISQFATLQGTVNIGGDLTSTETTVEGPFYIRGNLLSQPNFGITFNGPTATIDGNATVNRMNGTADVVIGGLFTWNLNGDARLLGTGRTFANGGMTLDGNGDARLQQRTLVNAGTGTWNGAALFIADHGQIINTGVFDIRSDGIFNSSSDCTTFTNAGHLIKSASSGVTQLNMALSNSGSIAIQTGSLSISCGYIPNGGQVVGPVSTPTIVNPGSLVLVPSPPITVIDFAQTSTGQLQERITGPTPGLEYGQLVVTGSVALGGDFSVEVASGYSPPLGQQFRVIDNRGSSSINGTFSGLSEGSTLWSGNYGFSISYFGGDGNDFVLTLSQFANTAPTAIAGGPYTVTAGGVATLNAADSFDAQQSSASLIYKWDLDGDGIFGESGSAALRGEENGIHPQFSSVGLTAPGSYTVHLRVEDQGGLFDLDNTVVNVLEVNHRPTLSFTTPVDGDFKTALSFSFLATDIDAGDAGSFVFSVDWGDGTTTTTAVGSNSRTLTHTFNSVSSSGSFVITASVQSGLGSRQLTSDSVAKDLVVLGWSIMPDPLTASLPVDQRRAIMVVVGSQGPDNIKVKTHDDDYYKITIRERQENVRHRGTLFGDVDRILVFGMSSNDTITIDDDIEVNAEIWGGQGDDQIKGGSGHDAIFGEQGNDTLYGGDGRDLIVGGTGADRIHGDDSDDILIAGSTAFDTEYRSIPGSNVLSFQNQRRAVESILAEWTSSRSFTSRLANLHGGTSSSRANGSVYLLENQSVFDDNIKDTLWGDSGTDWFFANFDGDSSSIKDDVKDRNSSEQQNQADLDRWW